MVDSAEPIQSAFPPVDYGAAGRGLGSPILLGANHELIRAQGDGLKNASVGIAELNFKGVAVCEDFNNCAFLSAAEVVFRQILSEGDYI